MKGYFIRSTRITPSVYFNPMKELLDIRGKSSPENPVTFYNSILMNLDRYEKIDSRNITINLAYEYFNTSSSKCIFMILKKIQSISATGKRVIVNWYFEEGDEDMMEAGEDFCSFFDFEFNFITVPEITVLGGQAEKKPALSAA